MSPPSRRRPLLAEQSCPEQLAAEFGCRSAVARQCLPVMLAALAEDRLPVARSSFERWKTLAERACGNVARSEPVMARLAQVYRLPLQQGRPTELLFAVQSYYALLVRLLVRQAVAGFAAERLLPDDPLDWCLQTGHVELAKLVGQMDARMAPYATAPPGTGATVSRDWFKPLYRSLFPGAVRHALGEYYTPRWLAEHLLDEVGYDGSTDCRLLDPSCGSGTFLLAAIDRMRRHASCSGYELLKKILLGVAGFDLNPVAVLSARANYLMAVAHLADGLPKPELPVFLCDSIRDASPCPAEEGNWDVVVGNPPWLAWDCLPHEYRRQTKPLWRQYGLFSLSANEARHGGAKKDLAMLMLYTAADRYLRQGGRLGMVITQTAFQSKGAGDGFRKFQLGNSGPPLGVLRVDDLSSFQPFAGAANWTATIVLEKGRPTTYPVPYVKWSLAGALPKEDSRPPAGTFRRENCRAEPIDPQRPSSPWMILPLEATTSPARLVGPSDYQARLGANSGGANGVYWIELLGAVDGCVRIRNLVANGKHDLTEVEWLIEPDLVYPLLRWADVDRYNAPPQVHLLLTQDADTRRGIDPRRFAERYPRTLAYLEHFKTLLCSRSAYRRYQQRAPYWSMYNVGPYTTASHKVVWRRMDRRIRAAVVQSADDPLLGPRPVIPQETCVLIATESSDEAHYLCSLLNSAVVDFLVRSHSVSGGKGFGTPSMLQFLRLKRFDPGDRRHVALAASARQAQHLARRRLCCAAVQQEIDDLASQLWGLTPHELGMLLDRPT